MTPKPDQQCGSASCLVDRLEEALTKQHAAGIEAIKELMASNHQDVKDHIAELGTRIKAQGDEIFPRLRIAESEISAMQASAVTVAKVKELAKEQIGLAGACNEDRVKELVAENDDVKMMKSVRKTKRWLIAALVTAVIAEIFDIIANRFHWVK